MPLLNFKKQFVPKIESGEKTHTIRAYRKDGRNPHVGDTLYLYTGLRTKSARKLGEYKCVEVTPIYIDWWRVVLGTSELDCVEIEALATADGFETQNEMFSFFNKTHDLPFYGLFIAWEFEEEE